jgi:hypothetical protein
MSRTLRSSETLLDFASSEELASLFVPVSDLFGGKRLHGSIFAGDVNITIQMHNYFVSPLISPKIYQDTSYKKLEIAETIEDQDLTEDEVLAGVHEQIRRLNEEILDLRKRIAASLGHVHEIETRNG